MAAMESLSSWPPHANSQPEPPMAQAPKPRVVIFNPLVPRERVGNVMMSPPCGVNVCSWSPINADAELSFQGVRMTTSLSVPDSAPQTSPGRPESWRTSALPLGSGKDSNRSVVGSKRTKAFAPKSLTHTLS